MPDDQLCDALTILGAPRDFLLYVGNAVVFARLDDLPNTRVALERLVGEPRGRTEVTNEAFARIKIDQLLKDIEWRLTDGLSVRFEYPLDDGGKADYALIKAALLGGISLIFVLAGVASVSVTRRTVGQACDISGCYARNSMTETWIARAKLPSFHVLMFKMEEEGSRTPMDNEPGLPLELRFL